MKRPIDALRASHPRFAEAEEAARARLRAAPAGPVLEMSTEAVRAEPTGPQLEAIILATLRPAWLVVDDAIRIEGDFDRVDAVTARKAALERDIRAVGRVDLLHHPTMSFVGTGWLIDRDLAVTNRHVAEVFAQSDGMGGFGFRRGTFGEAMEARLDTVRQHDTEGPRRRAEVRAVLMIAGRDEPDFAFLRVAPLDDVEPLRLAERPVAEGTPVAAIGYPAWDGGRNDPVLMERYFRGVYDVKRVSPGLVTEVVESGPYLLTDYTSLGGNSGSPVVALDTGHVVGLHFAGAFGEANYAVPADIVAAARARLRPAPKPGAALAAGPTTGATPAGRLKGRKGYEADFLGAGPLAVPLPALGARATDVAPVADDSAGVLRYTHFSVIQSASRRLPMLTAVNIDGARSVALKRKGDWKLDGRVSADHQIGNALYVSNPLDRGHMVRRRDPGWGSKAEAQRGEADTFHYTNAAPQHERLNQRDWVGLEDYILENAATRDFRASVFTGPVFRETDRRLKAQPGAEDVPIPEEFWKIAVMVNADTGALSATGYVLSHGPMIRDLTEAAFVYGEYRTYQVRIDRIEKATGFDFGALRSHDPLARPGVNEALFGEAAIAVTGPESLRL